MMTPLLPDVLADITYQLAYTQRLTIATASALVRLLVGAARTAYQQAGFPYGDDDDGFARWLLLPRGQVTLSA